MATEWDYEQVASPYNDTKVDKLQGQPGGTIDELPSLSIDIPDNQIIKNLNQRIDDSEEYWNVRDGFDLKRTRGDNMRLYLGKQQDVRSLYRFQLPYIENQIYIAEQAILAYVTAQNPQPEVSPAQDTPQDRQFALDLEKVQMAHANKIKLRQVLESAVRNALNKRIGIIYFEFDPNYGDNGEIIPKAIDPEHVIIDKNARMGENPAFIDLRLKMSVNELLGRWPEKKAEIFKACGIIRGTPKQLENIINVHCTWITHYDKGYKPQEAVVYYFSDLVLEKTKNPHWLYAKNKNFLDAPKKPFIALNFDNDGSHWIDQTSAVEQAAPLQNVFNKRGRQLMEVADKANGLLIVSSDSGLTMDDLQNLTGDPNQRLIIKTAGQRTQDMVYQVPPPVVPSFLYQDKVDLRTQIGNIMGAPSEFSGQDAGESEEDTLGQALMKKNQASGRQDLYVRAIDRFMYEYFNFLTQMMVVWYDTEHYFVYNGGDGEFDHLMMKRDLIKDGIAIDVKPGTSTPPDKQRQEAIVLQLLKEKGISLLDAYKFLHLPNPQQLYDNFAKAQADPQSLARDAMDDVDESKAYVAYIEIMAGKKPEPPDECTKEFILTLRKIMLQDEFLNAPKAKQNAFIKYVNKAIDSLELRTALDQVSAQGVQGLDPNVPLPPPQSAIMPPGANQPNMANTTPAGPQPPSGMAGIPPGQPPSPMNGTPMINPSNPVIPSPSNPTNIPTL